MFVLFAIPLLAAVYVLILSRRTRAQKLQRLDSLVAVHLSAAAAQPDRSLFAERFLPGALVHNLHLLGIEPRLRDLGIAAAIAALPLIAMAALEGIFYALGLAAAALLTCLAVLNIMAARRVTEIGALMPGFLDRVRQLLIIGNSLPTAFIRTVQGAQPRLAGFFAPALRRMGNGANFSETVQQSADDIGLYEMRLFAAAVVVNTRFGGSLTHSLNNLVSYLRKRASIERELRSSTAQIRASAWVLGLLPVGVAALIIFQNKQYASWFITHPSGRWMLVYCIISQIVGTFLMRMIVRTKF